MTRQLARFWLISIMALSACPAWGDERPPVERWHIEAAPEYRLVQGWMSFRPDGTLREHVGGDTDQRGLREPLDLTINSSRKDDSLRLVIKQAWKDKTAELSSSTTIPKDAEIRISNQEKFKGLIDTYQVLWRADVLRPDVLRDKKITTSVVFVARRVPVTDKVDSFDKNEVAKALEAVKAAQATPQ
jgi:hypothetical protein